MATTLEIISTPTELVIDTPDQFTIEINPEPAVNLIEVAEQGPQGIQGIQGVQGLIGPEGPQGDPGSGGLINFSAGGTSQNLTNLVFGNSNGLSFGLSNSTITGSHNGLTAQSIQTQNMMSIFGSTGDVSFANANGITFGGNNSTLTASHNGLTDSTPFRLTANNSQLQFTSANSNFLGTGATQSFRHTSADSQLQFTSANSKFVQEWEITGNTAGTGSSVQGSRLYFSGGNNITLSGSSNTILIQGGAGGGGAGSNTLGMSNIGNTAGNTAIRSGSAIQLVFAGGNNITLSQSTDGSNATITVSGANTVAQSVQTQNMVSLLGSTGDISFGNANGITFGGNNSTLTASHNALTAQSNQTVGGYAVSNTTQQTSGTFDARSMSFQGAGGVSVGISNGSVIVSGITGGGGGLTNINVSAGGNSYDLSAMTFADSNGITFGISASTITGTVRTDYQSAGAYLTTAMQSNAATISNVKMSAGTQSGNRSDFTFADSNGISFGLNNGVFTGTVKTDYQTSGAYLTTAMQSNAATISNVRMSAGTLSTNRSNFTLGDGNGISFGLETNGIFTGTVKTDYQISGAYLTTAMQSNAATISNINISGGTTSQNLSKFVFADSNGLSFGLNGSTMTGTVKTDYQTSGAYLTTAMQSNANTISNVNLSAGTTSQNLSQFVFSNSNGVSFGLNGSTVTGSHNALTDAAAFLGTGATASFRHTSADTQLRFTSADSQLQFTSANTKFMQEWSLVGNTAGTNSSVQGSRLFFSGGNNITLSGSSNTILIQGGAGAGGGIALANSQTTYTSGTAHLSGAGAITIQSTTGQSFQFSVPATSSLSALGNLTITPNGSTLSFSVNNFRSFSSSAFGKQLQWAQSSSSLGQNSVHIWPEVIHEYVLGSVIKVPIMITATTSGAAAQTRGYTMDFGVYTRHATNSTVLTHHYSTSYTASVTQSSNASFRIGIITAVGNSTSYSTLSASSAGTALLLSINGAREFILPWETTIAPGEYWFAMRHSSSSAGAAGSGFQVSHLIGSSVTQNQMGVSINSTSPGVGQQIGQGVYSATSAALPAGISMTQINMSALVVPVYLLGVTR